MKLPRVLVIDDQYARDSTERDLFLDRAALTVVDQPRRNADAIAVATICSGQVSEAGSIRNDYGMIRKAVERDDWALVLLDARFDSGPRDATGLPVGTPGDEDFGEAARRELEAEFPDVPVVMLTSKRQQELGDLGTPLRTPYCSKTDCDARRLRQALLQHGHISMEQARRLLGVDAETIIESPLMLAIFRDVFVHAPQNVSILILGESGVGKEVLARFVHKQSDRHRGPFVGVNIAAVSASLLEAELFGIEKGIATEVKERPGFFELADGGTLFLDEIGDMPLETQAKVLRVLQERKLRRVGAMKEIAVNVRLVCATSRDLRALITKGQFREDLYYRVNNVMVTIPPLRDRSAEIGFFAEAFLSRFCREFNRAGITFAKEALVILTAQPFPGNVRQLENLVRRLASGSSNHRVISVAEVEAVLGSQPSPGTRTGAGVSELYLQEGEATRQVERHPRPATLQDVTALLEALAIDKDDPALKGFLPKLETVVSNLRRRLAGAALERTRNPLSGEFNRQGAMQLLSGDGSLKGKGPQRLLNDILGRRQEHDVSESDLEELVRAWATGDAPDKGNVRESG